MGSFPLPISIVADLSSDPRLGPSDTVARLVTPEGVALEYRLAGPASRAAACLIDGLIKMVILTLAFIVLQILQGYGMGFFLLLFFVLEYFYFVGCELLMNGQSPGKRVLSLRVVSENGTPMTWQQSLLRNLLRVADQLPGLYVVGGVLAATNARFQRLGDVAAGTIVVLEERLPTPPQPTHSKEATVALMRWIPSQLKEDRDLRTAVALYAHKRDRLPPSLRRELAQPIVQYVSSRSDLPVETDPDLLMAALHRSIWDPGARAR